MGLAYYNSSWLFLSIARDTFTQMTLPLSVSLIPTRWQQFMSREKTVTNTANRIIMGWEWSDP